MSNLGPYDLGEYNVTAVAGHLLPRPDVGKYALVAGAGVLPSVDIGKYTHDMLGVGVLPVVDIGKYARVGDGDGALASYDLGDFAAVVLGAGTLKDYDLGEYAHSIIHGGTLPLPDIGKYTRTEAGAGVWVVDIGKYSREWLGDGTLGQYDLGEFVHTTVEYDTLGNYDLGEFARTTVEYDTLGSYDLGEYARIGDGDGALGQYDLGEYSYIWAYPPAGKLFPEMSGLQWDVLQQPEFATTIGRGRSRRECRSADIPVPRWNLMLRYDLLRDNTYDLNFALQRLYGFFLERLGTFDSFLYTNPRDTAVADQVFGVGDGVTQSFQLARTYGAGGFTFTEAVKNVKTLDVVKVDGVSTAGHYRGNSCVVDAYGMAAFERPPAAGEVLTWDGSFYYRSRFADDVTSFDNFTSHFWSMGGLRLLGSLGNLI